MLARVVTLCAAALGLLLVAAALGLPHPAVTPVAPTLAAVPASGVTHPVTAVLLAFRAYDTLLEVAVVLLAVRIAAPAATETTGAGLRHERDEITAALLRVLVPLIVLVAAVLMWVGTSRPGGAFAAGALAAGAGVALRLAGLWDAPMTGLRWRALQVFGLAGFVVLGSAPLLYGRPWLGGTGGTLVAIEAAVTVSIAAGLVSLFASAPPGHEAPGR